MTDLRVGVPGDDFLEFFGDAGYAALFDRTLSRLAGAGATIVAIDFAPFAEAAALLYAGPWVAERYAAIGPFLEASPDSFHPVTRQIIAAGRNATAAELFRAQHRLAALRRRAESTFDDIHILITPTAPTIYTVAYVEADPVALNSNLGTYTNFMNLLDLAAVAVPAGFTENGLPFGVTLAGPAWSDLSITRLGGWLHAGADIPAGAIGAQVPAPDARAKVSDPARTIRLAVNGAHMNGLLLNHELRKLGATLAFSGRTASCYRLYLIETLSPPRPGLVRSDRGDAIDLEVWNVPLEAFGAFCAGIPGPLGIGTVELDDGQTVKGFLCEADAVRSATEITEFGGWRAYLAAGTAAQATALSVS